MTGTAQTAEISVRHCHGLPEFQQCFELQRSVWGKTELDVPLPLFVIAAETGGQVLGAFDGEKIVGFTLAIVGYRDGRRVPALAHDRRSGRLSRPRNRPSAEIVSA